MTPADAPSLRTRLVWRVVLPLVLTWSLGSAAALVLASRYVQRAYDRALLDDAYAVAAQVVARPDGGVELALSEHELQALLYDQSERVYFALRTPGGQFLAGHGFVPPAPLPDSGHVYSDDSIQGRAVRMVSLRRKPGDAFVVVMAQTTDARSALLRELLLASVAVQAALLLLLAVWLRRAIGHQLQPLAQLQDAVDRRDADDLSPLPAGLSRQARTRDIARLGGSLDSLLARLARSLAAQREFSGNVAHELRTPLAGIRAQAEYALGQSDPAVWRAQLEGIARSQARASHTVDQLLALARADEATAALQLRPVALDELVREVTLRHLPRADAAGVDLGAVGLEQPCRVLGDAALIEGILDNLLDNALRYGTGAAAPRVTVELARAPGEVVLSVLDNGAGLSADECERLLARGAQGPQGVALGEGAGLGLAIVRRHAELLQARLRLEPAAGGGLAARLSLRAP